MIFDVKLLTPLLLLIYSYIKSIFIIKITVIIFIFNNTSNNPYRCLLNIRALCVYNCEI